MAVTKDSMRLNVAILRRAQKTTTIERKNKHTVLITKKVRRGVEL